MLAALEDAIRARGGRIRDGSDEVYFRCPFHEDQHPSCSWNRRKYGGVFKCHSATCGESGGWKKLALKLGISVTGRARSAACVEYNYSDESGALLFQIVRHEPKQFIARRPNGRGGWVNNLNGVVPVLYRLPEVLRAVQDGQTVFIVEGEKDADQLAALGLCATTNPLGAGNWRHQYSKYLRSADVVILKDNDDSGRRHGEQVVQSVAPLAAKVRVLDLLGLPDKGDVSDWLAAGGTRHDLETLVASALASKAEPITLAASARPVMRFPHEAPSSPDADTQDTQKLMSNIGQPADFLTAAKQFARDHTYAQATPDRLMFFLAQHLRAVPGADRMHPDWDALGEAVDLVCSSFERTRDGFAPEDRDQRWGAFVHGWWEVKFPAGHRPLKVAWESAMAQPIVVENSPGADYDRVASVLYHLQRLLPDRNIFFDLEELAALLGKDNKMYPWRIARWLEEMGLISLKKGATKHRNREFRFNLEGTQYRLLNQPDAGLVAVLFWLMRSLGKSRSARSQRQQRGVYQLAVHSAAVVAARLSHERARRSARHSEGDQPR